MLFVERNYLSHVGMFATQLLEICLPHECVTILYADWLHHGRNSFYILSPY